MNHPVITIQKPLIYWHSSYPQPHLKPTRHLGYFLTKLLLENMIFWKKSFVKISEINIFIVSQSFLQWTWPSGASTGLRLHINSEFDTDLDFEFNDESSAQR